MPRRPRIPFHALYILLAAVFAPSLRADVTLIFAEPYGGAWSMNVAHVGLYFSRVCAESPTVVRRCNSGESGAIISRYHRIDNHDWLATPFVPYIYGVEERGQSPSKLSPEEIARLREVYRRNHLESVAPDAPGGGPPDTKWHQLVGAAFERRIYGLTLPTTEEQDDRLIQYLNSHPNRSHFNLVFNNCANFIQRIMNLYYPGIVHRGAFDLGIMLPKQVAKCFAQYHVQHPELTYSVFKIDQIPGENPPSKPVRRVLSAIASTPLSPPPQ